MIRRCLIATALTLCAPVIAQTAPPAEAEIAKLIVGKWTQEEVINGATIKATTTYQKDGSLSGEAVIAKDGRTLNISVTGTWRISGSNLIEFVEKGTPPQAVPAGGKETTDEVLEINDNILRYKTDKGEERTKTRAID